MDKPFTIIDQIALATFKPELFEDKEQLKKVLEIKQSFRDTVYEDYKKELTNNRKSINNDNTNK
tara:strand:+ start:32 stop:223 length:192 start_codon:yes stop_codon:yes gene_type:complete